MGKKYFNVMWDQQAMISKQHEGSRHTYPLFTNLEVKENDSEYKLLNEYIKR